MEKTCKPTIAGILNIVGGALNLMGLIVVVVIFLFFMPVAMSYGPGPIPELGKWAIPGVLESMLLIAAVAMDTGPVCGNIDCMWDSVIVSVFR